MEAARARPARIDLCRRDSSRKAPHRLGCDSRSAGAPSISRPPTSSVHALAKRHDTYRYRVLRKRERASCTRYDLRAHDALAQMSSTMTRGTLPSWRNARSCSSAHTRDDDFEAIRRTDFRLHPERQHEQPHALVLAALAVAHHRTLAVVHLRICARRHHDHDSRFQRRGCAQPGHEALHAGVLALESVSSTRSCQIAIALRPRAAASSITSRYGSHALVHGARPGAAKVAAESVDPPPLVAGLASLESVDTPGRWPVLAARPAAGSGLLSGHCCGNLDGNYRHKYFVYSSFTELRTRT